MRLYTSLIAGCMANHKADTSSSSINNPIAQYAPIPAALMPSPTPPQNATTTTTTQSTRTLISHKVVDELIDVLDDEQTMRVLEAFNADGEIDGIEKKAILKISKEKRRLDKIKAKKERALAKSLGRKKRQPSKCEENLPLIDNGRWVCNGKTEACMLECEPMFLRFGRLRKECQCDENNENCVLKPELPSSCQSVADKGMDEAEIEEMYHKTAKGYTGCIGQDLINGEKKCTDKNMKRSICTNTCDSGFTLVGDVEQKCMCDRDGCRWGTNGLNFMAIEWSESTVDPICKPANDVNFCDGLKPDQVPSGVTASCLNDRYDQGSRCQLECADPGQAFNGKIFDKIRYGSCSCPSPDTCRWTFDLETCEDVNECERNANACGANSMCVDRKNGFDCVCKCGYVRINDQCVLKSHKRDDQTCVRGWTGYSCNDPDRSSTYPCFYRGASIFRKVSEMDCGDLSKENILEQAIVPGDTGKLILAGNMISDEGALKSTFESLESVFEIQIHGNKLTKLGEGMFSQNCNLEVLSLGHGNYGMQMDSNVFLGADKLKILDLGFAETNITRNLFDPLGELKYLFLQSNIFPVISSNFFQQNTNVEYIDVTNSQVTKLSVEAFRSNTKLAQLLLRQNKLDMIEDGTFDSIQDLEWIDLGRNQLTSITNELFAKNENLRIVDLDSNNLNKVCAGAFETQKDTLAGINLSDNMDLVVELSRNFCNEDHCDTNMEAFWSSLAEFGAEC